LILVHRGIGVGFRLDVKVASELLFVGLAQMLLLVLLVVLGGVALIALEAKGRLGALPLLWALWLHDGHG
jgi:hypothetical protein